MTNQKLRFAKMGYPDAAMSPFQHVGKNKIREMFKDGADILGIENPTSFSGHALRRHFVTMLVNDDGVSTEESLACTRHNSVAAQQPYMSRGTRSESNVFKALGITVDNK